MTKLETHLPLFRGHILKSFGSIDFILHQLLSRTKQPPYSKIHLKSKKSKKLFFQKLYFFLSPIIKKSLSSNEKKVLRGYTYG